MPARLAPGRTDAIREVLEAVGKRLAADGYHGVVGVDAMLERDGGLLPLVEINARNNMATYQARLHERFLAGTDSGSDSGTGDGPLALARQYQLRLARPLGFAELRDRLGGLLLDAADPTHGLLVDTYATVNAAAAEADGAPFTGRLHGLVLARDEAELDRLDAEVCARLAALAPSTTPEGVRHDR
jgi:hypothetical protein